MSRHTVVTFVRMVLVIIALCWGVGQAGAQMKSKVDPANGAETIIDAAGRVHVLSAMRSTTPAQRAAAAQKMRQKRDAAAAKHGANIKREVKK